MAAARQLKGWFAEINPGDEFEEGGTKWVVFREGTAPVTTVYPDSRPDRRRTVPVVYYYKYGQRPVPTEATCVDEEGEEVCKRAQPHEVRKWMQQTQEGSEGSNLPAAALGLSVAALGYAALHELSKSRKRSKDEAEDEAEDDEEAEEAGDDAGDTRSGGHRALV